MGIPYVAPIMADGSVGSFHSFSATAFAEHTLDVNHMPAMAMNEEEGMWKGEENRLTGGLEFLFEQAQSFSGFKMVIEKIGGNFDSKTQQENFEFFVGYKCGTTTNDWTAEIFDAKKRIITTPIVTSSQVVTCAPEQIVIGGKTSSMTSMSLAEINATYKYNSTGESHAATGAELDLPYELDSDSDITESGIMSDHSHSSTTTLTQKERLNLIESGRSLQENRNNNVNHNRYTGGSSTNKDHSHSGIIGNVRERWGINGTVIRVRGTPGRNRPTRLAELEPIIQLETTTTTSTTSTSSTNTTSTSTTTTSTTTDTTGVSTTTSTTTSAMTYRVVQEDNGFYPQGYNYSNFLINYCLY